MKILRLFFLFFLASTSALAASSSTLKLRSRVPASYQVDLHQGQPRLTTNIISSQPRLRVKIIDQVIEKNERIVTIIHP